jgi:MFS family permease
LPVALNWFVGSSGAVASNLTLAIITAVVLVPLTLLVVDHPPGGEAPAPEPEAQRTADGSFSVAQLLSRPKFWAICIAATASMASSVTLGTLMLPMGTSWGFTRGEAALIQSVMAAVGIPGSILFGWLVDKLGGARTLALIAFNCAVFWALLLLQPPYLPTMLIMGLVGMHGAGAIPGLSRAIAELFGQASFSRGYGLNNVITLPFVGAAIVGSAGVYGATGSYAPALLAMAAFFAVASVLALYAASGRRTPTAVSPA